MVNVFVVRPTGKFLGQTEILKRLSRFPGWESFEGKFVYHLQVSRVSC